MAQREQRHKHGGEPNQEPAHSVSQDRSQRESTERHLCALHCRQVSHHPRMPLFSRKASPLPGYALVNRRIMVGDSPETVGPGERPGYLYREAGDDPSDSGWRVFLGTETQEDADNADNFQISGLETLATHHPLLRPILAAKSGGWEWDDEAERYVLAPPPVPPD